MDNNDWHCESRNIGEYRLHLTCGACPEQYDVFRGSEQVGYLRLRHGGFRAEYPDCGGDTVYSSEAMDGDGQFTDSERKKFLTEAVSAIDRHLQAEKR